MNRVADSSAGVRKKLRELAQFIDFGVEEEVPEPGNQAACLPSKAQRSRLLVKYSPRMCCVLTKQKGSFSPTEWGGVLAKGPTKARQRWERGLDLPPLWGSSRSSSI